jgi:hypothetical protein
MRSIFVQFIAGRMVERIDILQSVHINYKLFKNPCIAGTCILLAYLEHSEVCRNMYKLQERLKTSASYPTENTRNATQGKTTSSLKDKFAGGIWGLDLYKAMCLLSACIQHVVLISL